jgi:hypothetical protein
MSDKSGLRLYEVRGSLPPENGRTWRANVIVRVLAPDLLTAAQHVLKKHPTATLHDVIGRSGNMDVEMALTEEAT